MVCLLLPDDVEFSATQSTLFGTGAPVAYDAPGMARLALVTGATGFMAQHLVPDLIEGGWKVRASGRRGRPAWLPPEVAYEAADLAAGERGLEALCDGADTVFHLAGATSSLSSTEQMHESNVVATTNLVAAARSAGVGRFVHMGSTSVYGEEVPLPQPVPESVEPPPTPPSRPATWPCRTRGWDAVPPTRGRAGGAGPPRRRPRWNPCARTAPRRPSGRRPRGWWWRLRWTRASARSTTASWWRRQDG